MRHHLLSEASEDPYICEEQLLTMMQATQLCDASDPRGKVYALLSFDGKESLTTVCEADYTIQVSQLYNDVTKWRIHMGFLGILEHAG